MKKYSNRFFMAAVFAAIFIGAHAQLPVVRVSNDGITDEYSVGSIQIESESDTVELKAAFKRRGATARAYTMKPSMSVKILDEFGEELDTCVLGLRKTSSLILDAAAIDRICMRNRVCFDIWNEWSRLPYETDYNGRNGTEGKFVEMYMNNSYYGIYCLSDKINRKLLNLKKIKDDGSPKGALYKSGTSDIANQNNPGYFNDYSVYIPEWHNAWELSYPDSASEQAWAALADCFSNGRNANYVKNMFWLDNLAEYQIFIMALSITDNWGNKNRYVSVRNMNADGDNRRMVVTPWDLDTGLGGDYVGRNYGGNYSYGSTFTPAAVVKNGGPYPFSLMQGDAGYKKMLKDKWIKGRDGAFSIDRVCGRLDSYAKLLVESGAWKRMTGYFDSRRSKPLYVENLYEEILYVEDWYKNRFAEMDEYFGIDGEADIISDVRTEAFQNEWYTLSGMKASEHYKGILVSKSGLKVLKK